jgi:hypothetical protein
MDWEDLWRYVVDEADRRFGRSIADDFLEQVKVSCVETRQSRPRLIPRLSDERADAFLHRAQVDGQFFLVRYSRRKWLEALVSHGHLRIFPATRYDDPSLNPAIRDNELEVAIQPHGLTAEVFDKAGRSKGTLEIAENLLTAVSQTNYYVNCLSGFLSPDLFPDFDADACVIIRDPRTYVSRILHALDARLGWRWGGTAEKIKYIDPLNTSVRQFNIPVAKHFHYAYQQEWRVAWWPADYMHDLPFLDLELGSMADCCTLLLP